LTERGTRSLQGHPFRDLLPVGTQRDRWANLRYTPEA
jgi:hypothetical protein